METEFIAWLRERLPPHPCLRLGPGDDAAVIRLVQNADAVVTVDLLTEGVDFILADVDPRRVGHKALGVNLSDLAAMAARPVAALVALALPRHGGLELAKSLYEGLLPLAERFGVAIAGGDTNSWDGPLVVSITAIGETTQHGPWTRSGARPGDAILVTGSFGGSILGRHLDVEPRVAEALWISERYRVHAAIDVSDGLARDLWHLCEVSNCGAVVSDEAIPISPAAHELAGRLSDGRTAFFLEARSVSEGAALDHALADGEDFELILAVPEDEAQRLLAERPETLPLTRIGSFVEEKGLWRKDPSGARRPLPPLGFEHHFLPSNF